MVAYATNELISSSQFAKQFGSYLAQIKNSAVDKLAILKNNKVEAVMISKDEYERMSIALEELENQEIYKIVEKRLSKPYKTISHEDMLKRLNINPKDLED
jgi:PHD/YefM family antitoxin component YafN of YafNO toxin-antitoxin module